MPSSGESTSGKLKKRLCDSMMRQRTPEGVEDAIDSAIEWFEENEDDFPEMKAGYSIMLISSMAQSMLESEGSKYADKESIVTQIVEAKLARKD